MLRWISAAALMACVLGPARAAESYDNCTGYIDSLPVTLTTQGTWCLRKDLGTGMTSGNAIEVKTNNVIIDCNDFKIGGLTAGVSTLTVGIFAAPGRQNITVRNCTVRGFYTGIYLQGDNHLVEKSRVDLSTVIGVRMDGDGNEVRDNMVTATGGRPAMGVALAIFSGGTGGRVLDNRIHGVAAQADGLNQQSVGMQVNEGLARGNSVTGLLASGTTYAIQIYRGVARDNVVMQPTLSPDSFGIVCLIDGSGITGFSHHNTVRKFATDHANCNVADNGVEP